MTRDHDPFTQALLSLRDRIVGGDYGAGHPVVIVEEARRLKVSVTPVREALSRLSGEGFVERAASGGYFALRLDAAILRDRFRFQLVCLRAALDHLASTVALPSTPRPTRVQATFDQIIDRSGSPTLAEAYRRVAALLGVISRGEGALIPDIEDEAEDIHRRYSDPERRGLVEALDQYHARRIALAADLLIAAGEGRASKAATSDS